MISSDVHIISDRELSELKRDAWMQGAQTRIPGFSSNKMMLYDVSFDQLRILIRNYENATGKSASTIEVEY